MYSGISGTQPEWLLWISQLYFQIETLSWSSYLTRAYSRERIGFVSFTQALHFLSFLTSQDPAAAAKQAPLASSRSSSESTGRGKTHANPVLKWKLRLKDRRPFQKDEARNRGPTRRITCLAFSHKETVLTGEESTESCTDMGKERKWG